MKIIENNLLLLMMIICLMVSGCATRGGDDYSNQQERQAMTVKYGTVKGVRTVTTSNSSTGIGSVAGSVLGGVLGHYLGGGSARVIGSVGGALGGAAAGAGAEKAARDHDALELTILLDTGQEIVIVQDPGEVFHEGDKIRVLTSPDGASRVQIY